MLLLFPLLFLICFARFLQSVWGLGRAWALNVGDLLKVKTRTSDSLTGVQDVSVCSERVKFLRLRSGISLQGFRGVIFA